MSQPAAATTALEGLRIPRQEPMPGWGLEVAGVAGVPAVLDGGFAWVRNGDELEVEWARLTASLSTVPVGRDPEALAGDDVVVLGVWNAANWSVGTSIQAPMTNEALRVTGWTLTAQLGAALRLSDRRLSGAAYATGVKAWLLWMKGDRARVDYVAWEPGRPI